MRITQGQIQERKYLDAVRQYQQRESNLAQERLLALAFLTQGRRLRQGHSDKYFTIHHKDTWYNVTFFFLGAQDERICITVRKNNKEVWNVPTKVAKEIIWSRLS